jgi:putative transposase
MSIRKVNFAKGEFYHIYNRGNSKQIIFRNNEDYSRFISLLYISNMDKNFNFYNLKRNNSLDIFQIERGNLLVNIGAYCLMPNHFHLLLTEVTEGGISKFMQKLTTSYSMYFNKKYDRTGGLFEGKFKSRYIDSDRYLKYMFSYTHLNPIKLIQKDWKEKGIRDKKVVLEYLYKYKYSSYLDFFEKQRTQRNILKLELFPKYFIDKNSFKKEIFEWINYNKER